MDDIECPMYTPLLNDEEAITDSFLAQLASRSLSRPSSHQARSSNSQGRRTPVGRTSSNRAIPTQETTNKKDNSNSGANNTNSTNNNSGGTSSRKSTKMSDGRSSRARTKTSAKQN